MKRTLCTTGLAAVCLSWGAPAGATVLCAKKSGVVVVRAACKKKEAPLNLAQFGAVGPKGDKGDPGGLLVPCATQVGTEVFFTGCNVNIRSGSGSTDGAVNGLGNLIVGYNANTGGHTRTGSHNLIVGDEHAYSSYGGFVAGSQNTISAPSASVSGGYLNTASGATASVSGGSMNIASGPNASVSGGFKNTASGVTASVSGGDTNTASFGSASVSGGSGNTASGGSASVSGGNSNSANGTDASVSGGNLNTASGNNASVSGGSGNTASGSGASVSGGSFSIANGLDTSVSGGAGLSASTNYEWHSGQTSGFPTGTEY